MLKIKDALKDKIKDALKDRQKIKDALKDSPTDRQTIKFIYIKTISGWMYERILRHFNTNNF